MIKLFTLKQQKKEEEAPGAAANGGGVKKSSAALLRVTKDMNELNLPSTCEMDFPDANNLLDFQLILCPEEGYHRGGRFVFNVKISQSYPHEAPKVKCLTKVYHPNIDVEGNVCLNILREDWKPVFSINTIVLGLQYIFSEPNPDDPLNKEAAQMLVQNKKQFEANVQRAMKGGIIGGVSFERCLK